MPDTSFFERVHQVVRQIPPGKVATYGQIARMLDYPRGARTVGWALRGLKEGSGVPWFRVVTSQGKVHFHEQRLLLEQEGIVFDNQGQIDMKTAQWEGLSELEIAALLDGI
ncbi:MAG: MGMT family protein [Anaerolineae bacterium]|nr:MGMT family protein [Anaerolineae bacterium]